MGLSVPVGLPPLPPTRTDNPLISRCLYCRVGRKTFGVRRFEWCFPCCKSVPGFLLNSSDSDSDYFIFHASGRGYAPLTSFEYGPDFKPFPSQTSSPPPSLHFKVYAPAATARLLAIPPRFLPIFAALVGNDQADYSPELSLVSPRYPGQMDGVAIDRIALAMSRAASLPARTPLEIEGVLAAVVPTLLSRPGSDPHIIANLVRSALSYQLLRVEAPSPTFPLHPSPHDTRAQATSRAAYLQAFRQGSISSVILIFLKHGLVDPPLPIDNPDFSSPSVVLGKSIREVVYAILAHDLYLPRTEVVEHNRRQDHLHVTKVPIPSLVALLSARSPPLNISLPPSLISSPLPTRLSLYLAVLSTPPALRTLTLAPHRPLLLALHHIHLHSPRPWPTHALLSAFLTSLLLLSPSLPLLPPPSSPPNKHALQLTAELLTTMFHCEVLREALGLVGSGRSGDECYEGRVFHALLGMGDGVERVGEALEEGRREVLGEMMAAFGR